MGARARDPREATGMGDPRLRIDVGRIHRPALVLLPLCISRTLGPITTSNVTD